MDLQTRQSPNFKADTWHNRHQGLSNLRITSTKICSISTTLLCTVPHGH
jgi:hypothetical protein